MTNSEDHIIPPKSPSNTKTHQLKSTQSDALSLNNPSECDSSKISVTKMTGSDGIEASSNTFQWFAFKSDHSKEREADALDLANTNSTDSTPNNFGEDTFPRSASDRIRDPAIPSDEIIENTKNQGNSQSK